MFQSRAFTIFTHILGWFLFFSLPVFFLNQRSETEQFWSVIKTTPYWFFYGCYIFLFYFHTLVLLPRLFFKKKYFTYTAILLLLLLGFYFLRPFDRLISGVSRGTEISRRPGPPDRSSFPFLERQIPPPFPPGNGRNLPPRNLNVRLDITSIFLFIMILALSMAVEIGRQWRTTQQRALRAEADKVKAELSFLKAQINPHFLFNILNNIYSLAVTQNEKTAEAILTLSNLLRYITDEATADFVDLKREIASIQDYLALQQLRLSKKVQLNFSVEGNLENKRIAPLVLIPFIENVFKFGISNRGESKITIQVQVEDRAIRFYCQNPIFSQKTNLERTGIGLSNTRERLLHLYPGNHTLTIRTENGYYSVWLTLPA
ncbi:hypothetical protein AHMF7605_00135 [Adhaeribacter arboris]|uniref:Signal transduction histidine kinase internal region domain-containing protein n=1 Tax=Adhaeribacter arboris TaxID=2072846 RepID=A0A2T2Y953_9BACT|nr:histidine kinase [Adhaeribacter arboris]PSR52037.1 hypothetical protein AHMF7605_00135 [Adhaeribacter arboris]